MEHRRNNSSMSIVSNARKEVASMERGSAFTHRRFNNIVIHPSSSKESKKAFYRVRKGEMEGFATTDV